MCVNSFWYAGRRGKFKKFVLGILLRWMIKKEEKHDIEIRDIEVCDIEVCDIEVCDIEVCDIEKFNNNLQKEYMHRDPRLTISQFTAFRKLLLSGPIYNHTIVSRDSPSN